MWGIEHRTVIPWWLDSKDKLSIIGLLNSCFLNSEMFQDVHRNPQTIYICTTIHSLASVQIKKYKIIGLKPVHSRGVRWGISSSGLLLLLLHYYYCQTVLNCSDKGRIGAKVTAGRDFGAFRMGRAEGMWVSGEDMTPGSKRLVFSWQWGSVMLVFVGDELFYFRVSVYAESSLTLVPPHLRSDQLEPVILNLKPN